MNYNFTLIKAKTDCDILINMANQTKEDLEFRKLSMERQRKSATSTSIETETELISLNAEIEGLESVIAGLPEGDTKKETIFKKKKLEYKAMLLTERKSNYGVVSLIDKEFDIGCIEKQLDEANSFIEAVNTYKASL
jgi:hypothetical protein